MIYLWTSPDSIKNKEVGCYDTEHSPDRFLLYDSIFLKTDVFAPAPQVEFIIPQKKVLAFDCLPNNARIPLVNTKVRTIIEELAPNEVQFINADLHCTDGTLSNTYFYINVLHAIKCLDHEKSVYTKIPGEEDILSFKHAAYKENALNGFHIARDIEYFVNLLVNEEIKAAFDEAKVTGVKLIPPEDVNWY
ncbi:hypothetical protein J2N86_05425 [Legionella lytica]|uniref:Immunity MXAN-0049 protein domain-containing protein n=1 Tax=Legionella lytica TaxID=96232 RepID=A0ABY4YAR9_9GAMM|nr:DUF1629 domain-containing protein [Legionella lytica]USQ14742.1 hypothetical protein J2N86_05425 [Legionella lytica]